MDFIPFCAVWVVTHNQKSFIAQTIEGIVKQKTTFPFKIYIGDDYSTDGTREICISYKNKYPDQIELILNDTNHMQTNSINVFNACLDSGARYIGMCEGDDYWIDEHKLQKQVDFLEKNDEYSISFHNCRIINEELPDYSSLSNSSDQKLTSDFNDLARGEFIYTATCLFRQKDFAKFPKKYYKYINNYTLDLHNAQYGKIGYLNEVMSVYRRHSAGIWSMVSRKKTLINQLPTYKFYLSYFDRKYRHHFLNHLRKMTKEIIRLKLSSNDFEDFMTYYKDYIKYNFSDPKEIVKMPYVLLRYSFLGIGNILKIKTA